MSVHLVAAIAGHVLIYPPCAAPAQHHSSSIWLTWTVNLLVLKASRLIKETNVRHVILHARLVPVAAQLTA